MCLGIVGLGPGEMLLQEMATPGREVRWEHVPAHVNVQGNEVANGLAMEGMCSSPLWSQHVASHSSTGSESTVGLRGGSGSESEDTKALWSSLGMVPMDSDELIGEARGGRRDRTLYADSPPLPPPPLPGNWLESAAPWAPKAP